MWRGGLFVQGSTRQGLGVSALVQGPDVHDD